jgi:ferritin-like metal-binding protein YciE
MSDTLVQYLREARATEAGLTQTLAVHIAATPPGDHRARLEQHLDDTRAHERLLAERLGELGGDEGSPLRHALSLAAAPVGFGLGVARGATRAVLSVVGLPLTLLRQGEAGDADRVLRNVRAEAASEAMEVATYSAIERLAEAAGDTKTARLAARIRADEEGMLDYLREATVAWSDRLVGRPRTARPAPATGRSKPAPSRVRRPRGNGTAPSTPTAAAPPPPPPAAEPAPEPPTPAAEPAPEPPTPAPHVSEEPELVAEVAEAGAEEAAGPEVEIREPWQDYDRMKAAEIERRLEDASDELAAVARLYEAAGKNRQTVLRAADRRLRTP